MRVILVTIFKLKFIARYILLFLSMSIVMPVFADFYYEYYDSKQNRLFMHLTTLTAEGDILLKVGDKLHSLKGGKLLDDSRLSVYTPCEFLTQGATVFWATGYSLEHTKIPPQQCNKKIPITVDTTEAGECWVYLGNNTLWRAATELAQRNGATIYQNIYSIFRANKESFADGDINRLRDEKIRCPTDNELTATSPQDAYRLFTELIELNK
ncbi:hypothetical protein [Shewanella algae]|uniref:hypothetical protein n=1 Tax=Shewanella algae TaxID=38313 RepID=UPI000F4278B8|nr:hypothetical protein [Shewanella algae]AYV13680.1 hypothetical protein EEY24_12775 [Shewanella algae]